MGRRGCGWSRNSLIRVAVPELADGYHPIPAGKLATIVTSLEMRTRPVLPPESESAAWVLEHRREPELGWYRALFRRIGEPYLWASRLEMGDEALGAILTDPRVEVYCVVADGAEAGILELDFGVAGECELTFFGVTPRLIGSGAGRWMMQRAIERAWSQPIARFWVHTCSLDHPAALPFYRRAGFVPFRCDVEIFSDPRTTGIYPAESAPQIPLFRS